MYSLSLPPRRRLNSLPAELLVQIFFCLCERPAASTNQYDAPSFSTPLFLGKICRHWRNIAWSIASFWDYIDLVLPTTEKSACAELLADWLERSQNLPLTIIFRREESKASLVRNWGEQTLPLFHLISNEWYRWESIDLFIPHRFCTSRINLRCKQFVLLHTATIRGIAGPTEFPDSFLQDAPVLSELSIHISRLHRPTSPYFMLTQFKASSISLNDVINILVNAPNIHTLFLADINSPATAPKPIVLETLKSLNILNLRSIHEFLDNLQAPSLLRLHLEGCARIPLEMHAIHAFIQLHGPLLQTLVLGGFWEQCISPLLTHTPRLQELRLRRDGIRGNSVFQQNVAQNLAALCHLQSFSLFGVMGPCFPILDVIKRRWITGYPIADNPDHSLSSTPSRIQTIGFSSQTEGGCRAVMKDHLVDEIRHGISIDFIEWVGAGL
ncbi:hypothetical protein HYPSUDRAFT_39384 [Hypholoma sublateritium FD-334 SS-4]|uniref:F-box domain-containing protein n=1 Tax=Hypholoma sublateritium (strain FD-334 SS-4) TaxID=945553 RepID=A0A0D2NYP7_HYPSF|nr:hypothetical protein HYPSUDRAFT_39384 [Hypholoma sublateritium FD-334 SS-4]